MELLDFPHFLVDRGDLFAVARQIAAYQIQQANAAVFVCKDSADEQHFLWKAFHPTATTNSRLKQDWEQSYKEWTLGYLGHKRYVYIWADGIYSHLRIDERLCLLVVIGSDEHGCKELIELTNGYRESAAS